MAAFRKAASIAPRSTDVRMYVGLHLARGSDWAQAVPMLEQVLIEDPERLPALSGLALLRVKQNRPADALALWQQVQAQRAAHAGRAHRGRHAGDVDAAHGRGRPRVRRGARSSRDAPFVTISSLACSTWRAGSMRRRATRSTGGSRQRRMIRWRSSSARRSACCSTKPTAPGGFSSRGTTQMRRPRH